MHLSNDSSRLAIFLHHVDVNVGMFGMRLSTFQTKILL